MGWTSAIIAKVHATKSRQDFLQRTQPIHHIGPYTNVFGAFRSIWVYFGSFRNCMKLVAKHTEPVQLMQKCVPRSRVVILHNQRTPSTPLDPELMFRLVS